MNSKEISMHIPSLMPDEFILGYLGRIGAVNGFSTETKTRTALGKWFKANTESSSRATLTEQLAYASRIDIRSLVRHHTLIPAFRAVASYCSDHLHGDPRDHGLLSAHGPRQMRNEVQMCRECIEEDLNYLGFSFWRRSHQLPGIDWCQKHMTPLMGIVKQFVFFEQPHVIQENHQLAPYGLEDAIEQNAIIRKYSELIQVALDFQGPIAPQSITQLLAEKAREKGLRTSPLGKRPVLSDLALQHLPERWITKHFPSLMKKKPREFLYEYDGVCKLGGKAHTSTSYILAIALLYDSYDAGHKVLSEAQKFTPTNHRKHTERTRYSNRKIISAYTKSNGNIKEMAKDLKCNYNTLRSITKRRGLPAMAKPTTETLRALKDFYNGAQLHEVLSRPNVQSEKFIECVRIAGTAFAQTLETIAG